MKQALIFGHPAMMCENASDLKYLQRRPEYVRTCFANGFFVVENIFSFANYKKLLRPAQGEAGIPGARSQGRLNSAPLSPESTQ